MTVIVGDPTTIVNLSDGLYALTEQVYLRVLWTGDSIYKGVTANTENDLQAGARQEFVQLMANGGYRIDMVGEFSAGPLNWRERQHQALSGRQVAYAATNISTWMATYFPDVVVSGFGVNNALQPLNDDLTPKTEADILGTPDELSDLLDDIHSIDPRCWVLAPTITPVNGLDSGLGDDGLGDAYQAVVSAGYRTVVAAKVALGRRVKLVELHPTMTYAHISDGVHPNALGYTLMAQRISAALLEVLTEWAGEARPAVSVTAARSAAGVLTATVTAGAGTIESIMLDGVSNATVAFAGGAASGTWPRRYVPGSPVSSVSVALTRTVDELDVSARLVIYDDNGPWPALVGAGPAAL